MFTIFYNCLHDIKKKNKFRLKPANVWIDDVATKRYATRMRTRRWCSNRAKTEITRSIIQYSIRQSNIISFFSERFGPRRKNRRK